LSTPYLQLTDFEDNVYTFPPEFWLEDMDWQISSNVKNLSYVAGGKNVSDSYLQSRTIVVATDGLMADTLAALETKTRALQKALMAGGYLTVSDDTVSRYIQVKNANVSSSYQGTHRLEKPFSISFIVEYPFWEDSAETEDSNVMSGGAETFTVDNSGSDFVVLPIIKIAADQASDLPSIKLQNVSDGGMTMEYTDEFFSIGDELIIDSKEGTVKRNGNNTIEYFYPARFLRLQNKENTLSYEGNACTITVAYRRVYL